MRVLIADLKGTQGLVSKDTVAAGFGSRLLPFSRVTSVYAFFKKRFHGFPSIQIGYAAAVLAAEGHDVQFTAGPIAPCDTAIVLSSLVDYRNETAWADAVRRMGARVGYVGIAASKLPQLFKEHADFVIQGEPEGSLQALARGERLSGLVNSPVIQDLDSLPFPRWDILMKKPKRLLGRAFGMAWSQGFPVMASRSCPEFCTYCPHRILAEHRERSVPNILAELELLAAEYNRPHVVFRDPLFTYRRERLEQLCHSIIERGIGIQFECETRLDCLDEPLLNLLKRAGLRAISFGVESLSEDTLRRVGRRPIPGEHQRNIMKACADRGIETCGFYVFGFLEDTWDSIGATINYAIALGSNFAQFKMLTPYPGTPLYKRLAPLVYDTDWENFDGFTPTFTHPSLTSEELRFLLGAAYSRFYLRPSFAASYLRIQDGRLRQLAEHLDKAARRKHREAEATTMSRVLEC